MVKDDQQNVPGTPVPAGPGGSSRWGRFLNMALLVGVVAGLGVLGMFGYRWLRRPDYTQAAQEPPPKPSRKVAPYFSKWPTDRKPDLVFLLTGQQFGYNKPCGCSEPQYGGLPRRWNFIQREIKARGWPIVALDLGDVPQGNTPQPKLKYVYSMRGLKLMDYTAVGLGEKEFALPITDAIDRFFVNEQNQKTGRPAALAANLQDPKGMFLGCVQPYIVNRDAGIPVGIIGLIGPSVAKQIKDPEVKLQDISRPTPSGAQLTDLLPGVVRTMGQKDSPEMLVLLYQGTLDEARALANHYPKLSVILSLSEEDEPREEPLKVGNTLIINVGHKGKKVGVLGVYRMPKGSPKSFEFHYQLCSIGPEYDSAPGEEKGNPMMTLLEDYAREVKAQNFLAQHIRSKHPIQTEPGYENSTYVGSEKCKHCHEESYQVWKHSPHAKAYQKLVEAKRPSLQQFDPECLRCHVTGLNHFGGFKDEASTPNLKDNGCENCHGPGSMHIKNKDDKRLQALMNPLKTKPNETPAERQRRINALNDSCRKCHDEDNDVHWDVSKWEKGKIFHKETKEAPVNKR
jgi:hypothetical protein